MKKYFLITIFFLISGCVLKEAVIQKNFLKETANIVKINNQTIKIEIADTPKKQYQGLSFRKNLCADCGMLFKFSEKNEKTFVMRNMNFPLDIIFIDGDKIVKIYKDLKPEGESPQNFYSSDVPVDYILEVNGGWAERYGIEKNNYANIPK